MESRQLAGLVALLLVSVQLLARVQAQQCPSGHDMRYRDFAGLCNNLENPTLGSAGMAYNRIAPADYADGLNGMTVGNPPRPSARVLSNVLDEQSKYLEDGQGLSDLWNKFGQFVDHDIGISKGSDEVVHPNPIVVPEDDLYFDEGPMLTPFKRSAAHEGTGVNGIPRETTNRITSYLDLSQVYGSSKDVNDILRAHRGGLMKSRIIDGEEYLPPVESGVPLDNIVLRMGDSELLAHLGMAGDVRANENGALLSLHTLFLREHNRYAKQLAARMQNDDPSFDPNTSANDELLFQETRRYLIGVYQHIVFDEWLRSFLGKSKFQPDAYKGYDKNMNPALFNEFATACYRLGHTQLIPFHFVVNEDREETAGGHIHIHHSFFNPKVLRRGGGLDNFLRGMALMPVQMGDLMVISDVRNFLFGNPNQGGLDLASLNVQRGRDHGLADFNTQRQALGGSRLTSFDDLTNDASLARKLEDMYKNVDNIDSNVGYFSETPEEGASSGETTNRFMVKQFNAFRYGDRYWFENTEEYTPDEIAAFRSRGIRDIVRDNTNIRCLQKNPFIASNECGAIKPAVNSFNIPLDASNVRLPSGPSPRSPSPSPSPSPSSKSRSASSGSDSAASSLSPTASVAGVTALVVIFSMAVAVLQRV